MVFEQLTPEEVWRQFDAIRKVPRPSKKEEKIIAYLMQFGIKQGLETKKDQAGNVLIRKEATPGNEQKPVIILQSHVDMVCEKNNDVKFDFDKDPIDVFIADGWVKAKGTTLGADDGIGIAAQLAVLESKTIQHGPIECLFTVDEETGLTGANNLEADFLTGKILINLDSEDEGEIFIGCAGGVDTLAYLEYKEKPVPEGMISIKINVSGLTGGHSGDDIHRGLGNSIKILNRLLWNLSQEINIRISTFEGGNLRNAIPREAEAVICLKKNKLKIFTTYFETFKNLIKEEFKTTEKNLAISWKQLKSNPDYVINKRCQRRLLNSIYSCPNGVISWSQELENLVETSTNLASVKFVGSEKIVITTSQRSSVESRKDNIAAMVKSVFSMADAKVVHTDGYPGWTPDTNSKILKLAVDLYKQRFGNEPVYRAIHAGLECGLFLKKYPGLDMISIGPTIKGAHSPDERLEIATVEKFWLHLVDILEVIGD